MAQSFLSESAPQPAGRTPSVAILGVIIFVGLVAAAIYFLSGGTDQKQKTAQPEPTKTSEVYRCPDACGCTVDCTLVLLDAWTGGKSIIFHFSKPEGGAALITSAERIGADGKPAPLEMNEDWMHRFSIALNLETILKQPSRQPKTQPRLTYDMRRIA